MFKRVLVALDGSTSSIAGLKSAIDLAADQRATLLALHIVDDGTLPVNFEGFSYPSSYIDTYFESMQKSGKQLLDKAAALAQKGGTKLEPTLTRSRGKSVAEVIVAQATKLKADIIVLGTHGRRGLKRVLMGSDAEEVVREARVPVLLVRGTYRSTRKPSAGNRRRPSTRVMASSTQ